MLNILTLTVNPSIDKSISVPELDADRKLHCKTLGIEPGGGGINVSRAISNLGGISNCWLLAGGYHGDFIIQLIREKKLHYKALPIFNETRENVIVYDESRKAQFLFDMQGPIVSEEESEAILEAVRNHYDSDLMVVSGSLARGLPIDFYARLAQIAKSKGIRFILDAAGESLALALKEGIYLCKPNLREFCTLTGAIYSDYNDVQLKAKSLIESQSCDVVVISLGAKGAILVSQNYCEHITAPEVKKVSTVGAGDSMVGGIVYQLALGTELRNAIMFGIASGTAATLNPGGALCTRDDTWDLYEKIKVLNAPI